MTDRRSWYNIAAGVSIGRLASLALAVISHDPIWNEGVYPLHMPHNFLGLPGQRMEKRCR